MAQVDSGRTTVTHAPQQGLASLQAEALTLTKASGSAVASLAWIWPIRGLLYALSHPQIILSVRKALFRSLGSSAVVFAMLAFFTYRTQANILSRVAGFLGPILALFLLGAESIFLLIFLAKPLFLEPALQHVFDATLAARGQKQLVKDGKTRYNLMGGRASAITRPLQALSTGGILQYLITLPLNIFPIVGPVSFICINGHRAGPGWHARYFQLKGYDNAKRNAFVESHRAEYTAFGIGAFVFSFVPIVGLVFTFTNTVGAALWAAELEGKENIIEGASSAPEAVKDK